MPIFLLLFCLATAASAHEGVAPPKPVNTPAAPWPGGKAESHDVIVPVILTIDETGHVVEAELEASVGEAFDKLALQTARSYTFEPAHDTERPRRARFRSVVRFLAAEAPSVEMISADVRGGAPEEPEKKKTATPAKVAMEPALPVEAKAGTDSSTVTVQGAIGPRSASETEIDRAILEAAPHRTASDLLLTVPGVYISQHSGEGKAHQIFFRGFDAVHGQDVEIWAAGAPVNDVSNIHGQGYADLHFMMPEVVKSIRALPGTYDPSQGDFAVAGSLKFDLGYDEPGATLKASVGNFGTRRYFLAYHPGDTSDATFAAAELYGTDGFGPSRAARRGSAIGQVEHGLGGGVVLRATAMAYAGRFDSAGVLRLSDIDSGTVNRFDTYDSKQGGFSDRVQLVTSLRHQDEEDSWTFAPYVVAHSIGLRSNFTGTLNSPEGDSIEQRNDATTIGATGSYRRDVPIFSKSDGIEAGISLRHDSIDQTQHRLATQDDHVTDDRLSPAVDAHVLATDVAGYLDLALHPIRRVTLRGGVRGDSLFYAAEDKTSGGNQTRSSQGAQLSKRGTADVVILPGLHGLLSYGEGFRSPQARQLSEGQTTPFTRVRSYEVGARYAYGRAVSASVAAFHTALSDDIVFDQSTARNESVPSTARNGLAMTFGARPIPWFLSNTSLTYTHAAFTASGSGFNKGDLLPYVPGLVVRSDMAFTPRLGRVWNRNVEGRFGTAFTFAGNRALPYGETGHDVFLVDALAEIRVPEAALGIDVYNLLGADWFDGEFVYASKFGNTADLVPTRHVSVGAPRSFLVSLSVYL